ncbi:TIGR00730 family Rossman fold protein [Caballeronia sp. LZ065]|uniref:LOG family protein n=1 Tax=Caballeronia sp. LZ065 TaxID=3038571 RepID=UPI002860B9CA|nr:TIGR00730 family Rossman fold protein [Caballeronia sp. LZ065]MDR5784247.1 TIGR00730 family Rossman fold protein [Caballeronia sp. LZ065]
MILALNDLLSATGGCVYREVLNELRGVHELSRRLNGAVSIFGSARAAPGSRHFEMARLIAGKLAREDLSVISGGGPGIMRAALEGARAGGTQAIGFNIRLPFEPLDTRDQDISLTFNRFFTRKFAFSQCSDAYVVMPGGMGTLDELFEMLTLIQTGKLASKPVALVDRAFWRGLIAWLREQPLSAGFIHQEDIDSVGLFDDADEVVKFVIEGISAGIRARRIAHALKVTDGALP